MSYICFKNNLKNFVMAKFKKAFIYIFISLFIISIILSGVVYKMAFSKNVKKDIYLYIPNNSEFNVVLDSLRKNKILENEKSFLVTSKIKKYNKHVKSGKYKLSKDMSNWQLVNLLRSGNQSPVRVTITSVRILENIASKVAPKLEFEADELINYLNSNDFFEQYDVDSKTAIAIFIPNTYEFYWNTNPQEFVARMKKEYDKFWTTERQKKAKSQGLTPLEVSILASIVQAEQAAHPDERPTIAGLYLNRLAKKIPLESDPTLIFAHQDFSIKRVYNYHKEIQSPYNTYLNAGLPPGPILMPEISSIEAVLNPKESNYIFMCAKDDLSGYHYFSTNLRQHSIYAKKYHRALNRLNIK